MSFHVYIEPELVEQLELLCKKTGRKRNAIMREALRSYLESNAQTKWPDAVFQFKPDPTLEPFETSRCEFLPERQGIFSPEQ
jgi:hypothetical protein